MSNETDSADGTPVVIAVEDSGHFVILADTLYDDENAVFLSDALVLAQILEEYPGARVVPWQPWSGEIEEVLTRAAREPGGCRWIEDEDGGAVHLCLCEDAVD